MVDDYATFFRVFSQVSKAIHSGENTREILEHIVTNIKEILGAKGCVFWIVDHADCTIETMISHGFPYRNLTGVDYDTLTTIFDPADGPIVTIDDARTDARIPEIDTIGKKSVGSIVGMFFSILGSCEGILAVYFYNQRTLGSNELEILTALGEQGAIALHKARSYDAKMLQNLRQMVEGLAMALEAKDEMTHGHSVKVADFARAVARKMELSAEQVETVYHGGLLHDIGKIGMEDAILTRLGILSRKEMDIVRQHPEIGARITQPLSFLNDVVPLIKHHHERYDGTGYPNGLKGDKIPLGARILTVCDAFETMIAGRKHLDKMSIEDAALNMQQGAGSKFDPEIVSVLFQALLDEPDLINGGLSPAAINCIRNCQGRLTKQSPPPNQMFL
ncbi:MAG: HD domain-containing protein [Desulfobulbaceae bacterium]|nr:MAG: HD domain-containing protein [Desulfobulbaceae bacterium]